MSKKYSYHSVEMFSSLKIVGFLLVINLTIKVNSQKIVIVGSGLSGYATAAKLIENGFKDIIILEAESRTGGRINSSQIDNNKFIDFGAQWVHGEEGNSIYEMMINENFKFGSSNFEDLEPLYLSSTGNPADIDIEDLAHLGEIAEKLSHSYKAMRNFNGSVGEFITTRYRNIVGRPKYADISSETKQQALDFIEKGFLATEGASSWFDVSAKLTASSGELKGNEYVSWLTEGYKTVFDFISKKRPDPSKHLDVDSRIQLNKEVTNIKWNPLARNEKVEISCADGSKYQADHVIFTASLGVLKARHNQIFTPNLPAEKIKAIENIGFGTLDKIFIEYETPFWPAGDKEFGSYAFVWKSSDIIAINGTSRSWLIDVPQFVTVDGYPNMLEAFVVGKNLNQFETISDEQLTEDIMWLLEKFLGKTISRPTRIFRTRWQTSKNFLGSYSYFSVNAFETKSTPAQLRAPLKDAGGSPKILFAGEATHGEFSSFANGAVSSGWDAGQNLADYLTQQKSKAKN